MTGSIERGNVREPPTSFLGRSRELRGLTDWFKDGARLITLLGPAGCGKTRLAARFAALQSGQVGASGGAWFCDLTEARDATGVVACVARAPGLSLQGGDDETGLGQLGRILAAMGPMLLVLDNCEQVVGDVARLVSHLREAAPNARVLATSRERLALAGERVFEVAPLQVPEDGAADAADCEAVQLFVDRARLVRAHYALTDAREASAVASIVRALDGIPLAIELAAARMGLMSAAALLARLDQRFELLADTGRDVREHRRTLRATIDWSWRLLEPWEQAALRQCSVFRGGFTLEAAEGVVDLRGIAGAPPVLETVQRLRDKSLVCAYASREQPSELRLGLYESIREYAAEKLAESDESEAAVERHAQYFLRAATGWAERAERGWVEDAWRLEAEAENVTAVHARALEQSLSRSRGEALQAATLLDAILGRSGSPHARIEMLERTTASVSADVDPGLLADVVQRLGLARFRAGAVDQARRDAERALELGRAAGDVARQGDAHRLRAVIEWLARGDAGTHIEAALAAFRQVGDAAREARALQVVVGMHSDRGQDAQACEVCQRAIELADRAGDRAVAAIARGNLGANLLQQGRLDEAEAALEESTTVLRAMRDMHSYFLHLLNLATVRQELGDLERAEHAHRELIAAAATSGRLYVRGLALARLGALLATRGETDEAAQTLRQAETVMAPAGERWVAVARVHQGHLDLALARECAEKGTPGASELHRAEAERRLAEGAASCDPTDDMRTALRWLRRALDTDAHAWTLEENGAWFCPPRAARVDVGDRQHARATLAALLREWRLAPGRPLTTDDVLRAAWPGEHVRKGAGAARVYVTIGMLRDLGLRDLLLSADGGYLLDSSKAIHVRAAAVASTSARRAHSR
jgi:predicted ATPase